MCGGLQGRQLDNNIMATQVTFGASGTYATLGLAIAATLPSTADFDYHMVGHSTENVSISIWVSGRTSSTQTIRIINDSPHNGNPNAGHKMTFTGSAKLSMDIGGYPPESYSYIWFIDMNITTTGSGSPLIGTGGGWGGHTDWLWVYLSRCMVLSSNTAVDLQVYQSLCTDCKLSNLINTSNPRRTNMENCTVYGGIGLQTPALATNIINCVATSFTYSGGTVYGYNNARLGGALSDSDFAAGSSGNIGNLVAGGEFQSVTATDDTYLFIKKTGSLANGGTVPVYMAPTPTDIAGVPIPDYAGWYPIGCHCANEFRTIYLPEATGSGKLYDIKNMAIGNIVVDAIHEDASGSLNEVDNLTLALKESIRPVDVAAHKWRIAK